MKDLNKVLMFVFMAIGAALVKWGGVGCEDSNCL